MAGFLFGFLFEFFLALGGIAAEHDRLAMIENHSKTSLIAQCFRIALLEPIDTTVIAHDF